MKRLTVTRKRADSLLSEADLRAVMAGDFAALKDLMPLFVAEDDVYVGRAAGAAWLGSQTLRAFGETAAAFVQDVAVTPQERRDIRFALEHKAPTLPGWYRTLDAAKVWGTPPWDIADDGLKGLWLRRFHIVENIRADVSG